MAKVTPIKAPVSAGSGEFEVAPEGVFLARCYQMVDVGTQTTTGAYGTKENRTIYLYWELLENADGGVVKMESGEGPFSILNSYTLSMHPKANLRKHLDAWRGKKFTDEEANNFDVTALLDKFCLLQITHSSSKDGQKTYANIEAIMTTNKRAPGVNEVSSFSVEAPDMEVFNALPEWLQNKIQDSPEWSEGDSGDSAVKAEEVQEDEININDVQF